jgi:hypothetical protein
MTEELIPGFPAGMRDFLPYTASLPAQVQTQTPYPISTERSFSMVKADGPVKLTNYLHLMLRLKIHETTPPPPWEHAVE